jgi:hypothetical protein
METRIRLVIVFAGLPVPVLQHPVGPYLLDMAYPAIRLAVEYDGQTHRTQKRALRDLTRQAYLSGKGMGGPALHRRPCAPSPVGGRRRGPRRTDPSRCQGVGLDRVRLY